MEGERERERERERVTCLVGRGLIPRDRHPPPAITRSTFFSAIHTLSPRYPHVLHTLSSSSS
eukprot:172637-Rhodomonas_salina.1